MTTFKTTDLRTGGAVMPPPVQPLDPDVVDAVRDILEQVRARGDQALIDLTRRFDGVDLSGLGLFVSPEEIEAAVDGVPPALRSAIDAMIERLRDLHARQLPAEWREERDGLRVGEQVRPVRRAGCYVPGGRAAYPSTAAMTVVPASVAGVEEVVVATPPRRDGSIPAAVLYAAGRAGAHRIVRVGGAHGVAALAFGTESVPAVDVIVGPGNAYVTAAKREVFGTVGIDGLAGPTELVIIADESAPASFVIADLEAQAEHDPMAWGTVVTTSPSLAEALPDVPQSRVLLVRDLDHAADVANELAPEHLQLMVEEPEVCLPRIRNAGAVFVGPWSAVPFGDYGVGSNHVLPTMRTARFASGLRVTSFLKVSAVVEVTAHAARALAPAVAEIARAEGLPGHATAVEARMGEGGGSR